jgi:hypothetical protein
MDLMDPNREALQAWRGGGGRLGFEHRARAASHRECSLRSADGCLDEMDPMDPMDLMDPNREALQAWQRGGGRLGFEHRARAASHRECSLRSADGCLDEMDPMDPMDLMDPNREALQVWQRGGGRLGFEHRARAASHRECSLRPADGCLDGMDPMDRMDMNREALQAWRGGRGRLGFEHRARATSHRECSLRPASDSPPDSQSPLVRSESRSRFGKSARRRGSPTSSKPIPS